MYDEAFKQRYIDSYSFIPMCLAKTTEALNLSSSEKGYFPSKFSKTTCGRYPDKSYYDYENMSNKDRTAFDEWYMVADEWYKELFKYGRNYVVLLREAYIKYCKVYSMYRAGPL